MATPHLLAVDDGKLRLGLVLICAEKDGQQVCEGGGGHGQNRWEGKPGAASAESAW
ncbi:MAG: hypothetical protein U0P45_13290 [Acidimicrobiales bacterium]